MVSVELQEDGILATSKARRRPGTDSIRERVIAAWLGPLAAPERAACSSIPSVASGGDRT